MIHRVVKYFHNCHDRVVYVVAHSIGAFFYPQAMIKHQTQADKVILLGGRLKFPDAFIQIFADGKDACFAADGQTIVRDLSQCPFSPQNFPAAFLANMVNLQHGVASINFIDGLTQSYVSSTRDLSNVLYISGNADQSVGRLSSEEVTFLNNQNARVLQFPNANHGAGDGDVLDTFHFLGDRAKTKNQKSVLSFLNTPLEKGVAIADVSGTQMNLYAAQGLAAASASNGDSLIDIGVVFEGDRMGTEEMRVRLNSAFGSGNFSLFQTPEFKDRKGAFRVYYGKADDLAQPQQNTFLTNRDQIARLRYFMQDDLFPRQGFTNDEQGATVEKFFASAGISTSPSLYAEFVSLAGANDIASVPNYQVISSNLARMDAVFDSNEDKNFDIKIYVSDGSLGAYGTGVSSQVSVSSYETIFVHNLPSVTGEEFFAKTLVHELGDLVDEYYTYGLDLEGDRTNTRTHQEVAALITNAGQLQLPSGDSAATKFRNNCFDF